MITVGDLKMKKLICLTALITLSSMTNAKSVEILEGIFLDLDSIDILKNPKRVAHTLIITPKNTEIKRNSSYGGSLGAVVNCTDQTFYYTSISLLDLSGKFTRNMDMSKYPSKSNPVDIRKNSAPKYIYDKYCK